MQVDNPETAISPPKHHTYEKLQPPSRPDLCNNRCPIAKLELWKQ